MRVVVTGGAGHIGSHLVEQLVRQGAAVTVLDDFSTGDRRNLRYVAEQVHIVSGSVTDRSVVDRVIEHADLVFHLAAAVGVRRVLSDPAAAVSTNVDGTGAVVEACHRWGPRLVFASTSEVYGKTTKIPMLEDDDLVIGAPRSPRWSYSLAKALDEHVVLEAGRAGLDVTVLRYFNSYGPRSASGGDASVVARFVRQAVRGDPITVYGDGSQVRCFTYVTDIARATLLAGSEPATVGSVCNVGRPTPVTIKELAQTVADVVGGASRVVHRDPELEFGRNFDETHTRIPDTCRFEQLTGWVPEIDFGEGLAHTIAWCRSEERRR